MPGLPGPRPPAAGILLAVSFLPPLLLLPAAPAPQRAPYKPVIVVHGLFDSSYSFRHLLDFINEVWRAPRWPGRKRAELKAPLRAAPALGVGWGRGTPGSSRAQQALAQRGGVEG